MKLDYQYMIIVKRCWSACVNRTLEVVKLLYIIKLLLLIIAAKWSSSYNQNEYEIYLKLTLLDGLTGDVDNLAHAIQVHRHAK